MQAIHSTPFLRLPLQDGSIGLPPLRPVRESVSMNTKEDAATGVIWCKQPRSVLNNPRYSTCKQSPKLFISCTPANCVTDAALSMTPFYYAGSSALQDSNMRMNSGLIRNFVRGARVCSTPASSSMQLT